MKVKGLIRDINAFQQSVNDRKKHITEASPKPMRNDPIKLLAKELHPENLELTLKTIIDISPSYKLFRFALPSDSNEKLPLFQPGQYACFKFHIGEGFAMRPYTISSSPYEAMSYDKKGKKKEGYIDITVEKKESSFVTNYIFENWKQGSIVEVSFPHGKFFYEPLRDSRNIVAIAEGVGINPFYSMIKEISEGNLNLILTLIYKIKNEEDALYLKEIRELVKKSEKSISLFPVYEKITSDLIFKITEKIEDCSYFLCGKDYFCSECITELSRLNIPNRRIRKAINGKTINVYDYNDFPSDAKNKKVIITVFCNDRVNNIEAYSRETILSVLERAGYEKGSHCHSGECGFCRSQLIDGKIYVRSDYDGRRAADKKFGYFHPCSSYAVSNIKIKINI